MSMENAEIQGILVESDIRYRLKLTEDTIGGAV